MKFAVLFALLLHGATATNTCVTDFDADAGVDYYPNKVEFEYASSLSVSYHLNYKKLVFTNWSGAYTTCVVKCGTTLPSDVTGCDTTISPETNKMAITSASMIPYIHSMGMLEKIELVMVGTSSIQNSCVLDLISDGTILATDPAGNGYTWSSSMDTSHVEDEIEFTLTPTYGDVSAVKNSVPFGEWNDPSFLGRPEWIEYLGALTDQEFLAMNIYAEQKNRIECITNNVETIRENYPVDNSGVKVLWATRSDYVTSGGVSHEGWDVATCVEDADSYGGVGPYYCEAATLLGMDLLNTTAGSVNAGGAIYMTNAEFEAYGKDATHWIYNAAFDEDDLTTRFPFITTFKSYQDKTIYDPQKRGMNDFFETWTNQADTFIEDLASITVDAGFLDGDDTTHVSVFYRNVFTEPTGSFGTCPGATLELLSDQCSAISEVYTLGGPAPVASLKVAAALAAFVGGAFLAL
ncbi:hypothetical protein TrVE_jg2906 [Triparma verrucosa]|uniref:Periplasmic binding protein-like II n=1 Tax=Triparma verrucosa TaxID=1606542 RepID=A0A9W7FCI8_9STRA|nr:hypothetical protein TrVE_jg2906 [Triparma verrucosa]